MKRLKYLFLETAWFLPVIVAQWLVGRGITRSRWKVVPLVALPMAAYLTARDKVALDEGTWTIDESTSTGWKIGGVPIEEALFFLLTSWVSAQGVILLADERSHQTLARLKTQLRLRRGQRDRSRR